MIDCYISLNGYPQLGQDCKDDLKRLKYDIPKVKLSLLHEIQSFKDVFNDLPTKETSLQLMGIMNKRRQTV